MQNYENFWPCWNSTHSRRRGEGEGQVGLVYKEGGEGEGGGRGRGGVVPKRLKSGSGHHRLIICGPSNGRHKIA